ncbi:hypothetical protein [Compostibacter hankyongensis]|uniref:Uncharacterized protein n=1 Tax=Compostibacter hankyongensis TaxID=1007089 RepID=A0ABP8FX73_9BACT
MKAVLITVLFLAGVFNACAQHARYIIISMNDGTNADEIKRVASLFPPSGAGKPAVGIGTIISYLATPPEETIRRLTRFLDLAAQYNLPVVVELDGINYWQARPDLWNWWDKTRPGYDPDNKKNVEWTGWTPDSAVKLGWRNWGSQHRVGPMPNLMSPDYLNACYTEIKRIIPVILRWRHALPAGKRNLLVSVQIGVECSIGVNNWYYPDGNTLLDKPEKEDPVYGLDPDILPGRGVQPIGYAAVSTLGIAKSGTLKEEQVTKAVYKYVLGLSRLVSGLGIPRDRLFVHAGGWKKGESVYFTALNQYACPAWSFYTFAKDPATDTTAMEAVARSDAPYWAAAEWLLMGAKKQTEWQEGLRNSLDINRLRYVQVRNWRAIKNNQQAIAAIQDIIR